MSEPKILNVFTRGVPRVLRSKTDSRWQQKGLRLRQSESWCNRTRYNDRSTFPSSTGRDVRRFYTTHKGSQSHIDKYHREERVFDVPTGNHPRPDLSQITYVYRLSIYFSTSCSGQYFLYVQFRRYSVVECGQSPRLHPTLVHDCYYTSFPLRMYDNLLYI